MLIKKKLCSEELSDPNSVEALMSCRLIPLGKNPGVRPIGIGELLRRIIGKTVMTQCFQLDKSSNLTS